MSEADAREVYQFRQWFYSAEHRMKYSNAHPAYLAAWEAWKHRPSLPVPYGMVRIDVTSEGYTSSKWTTIESIQSAAAISEPAYLAEHAWREVESVITKPPQDAYPFIKQEE